MKKIWFIQLLVILSSFTAHAQLRKTPFRFPDTEEYKVLKGDFHMHTVFSDGVVWPTTRVEEAYNEDLDVIALTEHIEYRPHMTDITTTDHNRSFEIAKNAAEQYGILLFHSAEVTRMMPPGHLNVINIQDANVLETFVNENDSRDSARIAETLAEARKQGGFIFWNHTAYPTPDNKSTWHPIHQRLMEQGLMMGIEVVNGERYEMPAFQWCLDHNLTILANTDVHTTMAQKRSADGSKVMTLILAKEKTQDSVMEALRQHRTAALWNNQLMGRRQHVSPIVKSAVKVIVHNRNSRFLFEFVNESGLPFTFEFLELPEGFRVRNDVPCSVNPYEAVALTASSRGEIPAVIKVKALNVWVNPRENLEMELPVTVLTH